jgi:hypothetical protein
MRTIGEQGPIGARRHGRPAYTTLRLQWPGYSVEIWSNSPELTRAIGYLWPMLRPWNRLPSTIAIDRFTITTSRSSGKPTPFLLARGTESALAFHSVGDALARLTHWLREGIIANLASDYLLIEASVVTVGARGVIVPGPPTGARSALTAALAFAGFQYLSDVLAVVDLRNLRLLPCLGPICLLDPDWHRLNEMVETPPRAFQCAGAEGMECYYLAAPRSVPPDQGYRLHAIFVPAQRPGTDAVVTSLPHTRALLAVTRNACGALTYDHPAQAALAVAAAMDARIEPIPRAWDAGWARANRRS